jgi:hypothetical protein
MLDFLPAGLTQSSRRFNVWRRHTGYGRWIYCKYCYKCTSPIALFEQDKETGRVTWMLYCSECFAGLTPPEEIAQ